MNGYFNYKDELYHYGVLGMKWGVRRYQPYGSGGYSPKKIDRKTKKIAKKYDYKKSDSYKNSDSKSKKKQQYRYKKNAVTLGRSAANTIEYKSREMGLDYDVERKKEFRKQTAIRNATVAALALAPAIISAGSDWINTSKSRVELNNLAADIASQSLGGLNEVKGGFTPGFKAASNGKKFADWILANGKL